MLTLDFKAAKEGFFDRAKVIDAVDRATLKVLSRFGAFVQRRAKSSMRRRKKASAPGQPPSAHVGLIKSLLFFSYDPRAKSVVIGPVLINRPTGAPETLEYGGDAVIEGHAFKTRDGRKVLEKTSRRVRVRRRPFMNPAFEAEKPGLPAMWANSVR